MAGLASAGSHLVYIPETNLFMYETDSSHEVFVYSSPYYDSMTNYSCLPPYFPVVDGSSVLFYAISILPPRQQPACRVGVGLHLTLWGIHYGRQKNNGWIVSRLHFLGGSMV